MHVSINFIAPLRMNVLWRFSVVSLPSHSQWRAFIVFCSKICGFIQLPQSSQLDRSSPSTRSQCNFEKKIPYRDITFFLPLTVAVVMIIFTFISILFFLSRTQFMYLFLNKLRSRTNFTKRRDFSLELRAKLLKIILQ